MDLNEKPLVSIVIPTYNRKEWLAEAVQSVLNQTYTNIEIIVIDDGSEEDIGSLPILQNAKVFYYKNDNHGVAYSRNYGMRLSKGRYIAFLDSDDFWKCNKIEVQVKALMRSGYKWSQHNYFYFDDSTKAVSDRINTYRYKNYYRYAQFCSFKVQTSCFMVERDAAILNGCFFDETKTFGEDAEFYLKMSKLYPLLFINEYLGYFRIRRNNAGKDVEKQLVSRAIFWKEHGHDPYVREHMSFAVVLAYRMCNVVNIKKIISNNFFCKIVYFLPWIIFKLETIRLERRGENDFGSNGDIQW